MSLTFCVVFILCIIMQVNNGQPWSNGSTPSPKDILRQNVFLYGNKVWLLAKQQIVSFDPATNNFDDNYQTLGDISIGLYYTPSTQINDMIYFNTGSILAYNLTDIST
eukprot:291982_1